VEIKNYFRRSCFLGGRVRRRTAAGTVRVGGRDASGRSQLGPWKSRRFRRRKESVRLLVHLQRQIGRLSVHLRRLGFRLRTGRSRFALLTQQNLC